VRDIQQAFTTSLVEDIIKTIQRDGQTTCENVDEFIGSLNMNESACRINAEILLDREPIRWYEDNSDKRPFML